MASKKENHYSFFQNKECEFFPCHKIQNEEDFNCLFCYCPLYALGKECGGNFNYDNKARIKDCSNCVFPHQRENYPRVVEKTQDLIKMVNDIEDPK